MWDVTNRDCVTLSRRDPKNRYAQRIGAKSAKKSGKSSKSDSSESSEVFDSSDDVCEGPRGATTSEKPTRGKISAVFSEDNEVPLVLAAPSTSTAMVATTTWFLLAAIACTLIVGVAIGFFIARHSKMAANPPFQIQNGGQKNSNPFLAPNQFGWKAAPPNNGGKVGLNFYLVV